MWHSSRNFIQKKKKKKGLIPYPKIFRNEEASLPKYEEKRNTLPDKQ